MTDAQATSDVELEVTRAQSMTELEAPMPLGFIVFGGLALVVQVLWLGLIGWWLLNLF